MAILLNDLALIIQRYVTPAISTRFFTPSCGQIALEDVANQALVLSGKRPERLSHDLGSCRGTAMGCCPVKSRSKAMAAFHFGAGLCFQRMANGDVEIVRHFEGQGDISPIDELVALISAQDWCDLVACVSREGVTDASVAMVRAVHCMMTEQK